MAWTLLCPRSLYSVYELSQLPNAPFTLCLAKAASGHREEGLGAGAEPQHQGGTVLPGGRRTAGTTLRWGACARSSVPQAPRSGALGHSLGGRACWGDTVP